MVANDAISSSSVEAPVKSITAPSKPAPQTTIAPRRAERNPFVAGSTRLGTCLASVTSVAITTIGPIVRTGNLPFSTIEPIERLVRRVHLRGAQVYSTL